VKAHPASCRPAPSPARAGVKVHSTVGPNALGVQYATLTCCACSDFAFASTGSSVSPLKTATSDSDFAYLCRKLRERGATVHIVGETKTPDALRNASDQFFEWMKPASTPETAPSVVIATPKPADARTGAPNSETLKPATRRRPLMVVEAVKLMAADTAEGKVHLGTLGQYLQRTDPAFSPQTYGHSGLLDMLRTYDLLMVHQEAGNYWTVRLAPSEAGTARTVSAH